jgi:hypothetical protein
MNIETQKIALIEWLVSLQDKNLLDRIELLKEEAIKEFAGNNKPMPNQEYEAMLNRAEEDYAKGNTVSQQDLEVESERW